MVTINQDGIVPVTAIHPPVMEAREKVREFQQAVRSSTGAMADREALHEQFEGWLHELKFLTLIAFRYKEQHDFFNRTTNPFYASDQCPVDATDEQKFQFEHNLVITAIRHEIEDFHIHTSILLDRVAGIYKPLLREKNAIVSNSHEGFLKRVKHRTDITYLPDALIAHAKWLQKNVDKYRNRLIIHPAGYENDGFHMRGVKSKGKENLRTFARAHVEINGVIQEVDKESKTLEVIIEHLCAYVEGVIEVLDQNHSASVLEDPSRPRPERVKINRHKPAP